MPVSYSISFGEEKCDLISITIDEKDDKKIVDTLQNGSFKRVINGEPIELSEKEKTRYSSSLNSVIYFAKMFVFFVCFEKCILCFVFVDRNQGDESREFSSAGFDCLS